MTAKSITPAALRVQLEHLRSTWPALVKKLRAHLPPFTELRNMLHIVGAPTRPEHPERGANWLRRKPLSYQRIARLLKFRATQTDVSLWPSLSFFALRYRRVCSDGGISRGIQSTTDRW